MSNIDIAIFDIFYFVRVPQIILFFWGTNNILSNSTTGGSNKDLIINPSSSGDYCLIFRATNLNFIRNEIKLLFFIAYFIHNID